MAAPFFSVVIDNHNYGRFLGEAIDSVLSQDFPASGVELIVVDDGSNDDSRRVIAGYGDRIRAVLQPQQGQAAAFNNGLAQARGEVVCLLDSDDAWRPQKLSRMAPLFADPAVGAAEHFLEDLSAQGPLPQNFPSWPARYTLADFLDGRAQFTATSGLCLRRRLLQKALPIPRDLFYYLDDYLAVRCLFESALANLPEVLGFHRIHGANHCAGNFESARKLEIDFRSRAVFAQRLDAWLAEFDKDLTPRFRDLRDFELFRRQVLYEAISARPGEAFSAWRRGAARLAATGFGRFRLLTCLLAVLSPTLYLSLYTAYARADRLKNLRDRLCPAR